MKRRIFRLLLSAALLMCCMVANAVGTQPAGAGTKDNPYQIATKDNLLWFADYVNNQNISACAILTADITVNNSVLDSNGNLNGDGSSFSVWTPIGSWGSETDTYKGFAGEFNGNGHTISGLYFNDENRSAVGLFGMADQNGYIHDVGIKDSYFRGKSHVAGICGDLGYGRIENCWNAATVIGTIDCAGGIAGSCWHSSSISGCYNIGKVSSTNSNVCGGICGSVAKNPNVTYSVSNCVSLEGKCDRAYNIGEVGAKVIDVYTLDASTFASGKACWILNGEKIDTKWRQQIGTDSYPVFTGNYLVNYYNDSYSYYYNETMCERSSNHIHNFEAATLTRCNNSKFTYWHCKECNKNYSYEGEGGHANQTKELSAGEISAHIAEWVPAVLPTATTTGRYGHWHCRLCGKDFADKSCTTPATDENLTVPVAQNNEIWYTTTDNQKLTPYETDGFGATYNDANNVYEKGLGKITFGSNVTSIGEDAFHAGQYYSIDCAKLQSIHIPSSVTSIGGYAFSECKSLTEVNIPSGVTDIGNLAFNGCSNLQSIIIPGSVKNMGSRVFNGCSSLNDVTIGDGAYIGEYAFRYYAGTLIINGSLSGVGQCAFENYTGLKSVSIEGDVSSIGEYAFVGCTGLTSISVKGGSIGNNAFNRCNNLSTVTLDNVTGIGERAFNGCSNLQSITIPGSVKSMGGYVFNDCTKLNNVTIEDGAYIGEYAFRYYAGTLTIKGSLSGVGESAFQGCGVLKSISVKGGSIGNEAFKNCSNLNTVTLESSDISLSAFKGCTGLESVSIKNGSIGEDAFKDCNKLSTVTLDNVTGIGQEAFRGCAMQSIIIPGSVKSMGSSVFANCTSLNNVTIEDGAYIGYSVFQNYTGALTINGSLSGVDQFAFYGCTVLTSISVKGGSIGGYAFEGCNNLSTVTLLDGVTGIDTEAFKSCSNLKDITVKWTEADKIPNLYNKGVFDNVDQSNVTLHVPTNTTSLYQAKEVWMNFKIYEDVNVIITKTDDTTIGQKIEANGKITIDERSRNIKSLVVSEEVENVSVTYKRNFANAGKWQAWYMPFDVSVADMAQAGLDVAEIYGILLDNDGDAVVAFLKMDAGTVKANTPYVVRPKEYGDVTVTTTSTLYQTKATQFAINSAKDTYTFGGIYEQTTTTGNWYAVNTSGQFQKMGTGVNLQPMRIWMTIDPRDDNPYTQPTEANAKMDIMVIGDDEPTGITSYDNENDNDNNNIYNLKGQRVTSIQSGKIYIMNGKKYIAK